MTVPPARSRGVIALKESACTVCMICVRECPSWCITIDSHSETAPGAQARKPSTDEVVTPSSVGARGKAKQMYVIDRFDIDYGLCMYCGICIEACPFDALFWASTYDYAAPTHAALVHDHDVLGTWLRDVPRNGDPDPDVV